jgi:DNA-binding MarR family transcriptional regulator
VKTLSLRQPRQLDELLNYRLLRLFAISGAPVVRLLEGRFGISRREWRLVALLAARGALSPSALALQAHLDRPRISRAVTSLVTKGLLARAALPGDARRALVQLTPAGRRLYDEVFPQVAAINARIVGVLDEADVRALDAALERLTGRAAEVDRELADGPRADRRRGGSRRHWPEAQR